MTLEELATGCDELVEPSLSDFVLSLAPQEASRAVRLTKSNILIFFSKNYRCLINVLTIEITIPGGNHGRKASGARKSVDFLRRLSSSLETKLSLKLDMDKGELVLVGESPEGAAPPQLASHSVRLIRAPLARSGCLMLLLTSGRSMPSFLIMRNTATFNSRT